MEFRKLKSNEIDCRIGNSNKAKTGFSLLLYKDARCDMNILDETLGCEYWQRDHKEIKGVVYCGVSIWNDKLGQWVTKWDAGTESNTEKEKGEASDSFKRACFNLGLGRELYTAPFIWIKTDNYEKDKFNKYSVDYISYDDNGIIDGLSISVQYGGEIFKFGNTNKPQTSEAQYRKMLQSCKSIDDLTELKKKESVWTNSVNFKDEVMAKYEELK